MKQTGSPRQVGVGESNARYGAMNITLEREHAPAEFSQLLADINFIPTRSLEYEMSAFVAEVVRQGLGSQQPLLSPSPRPRP